MMEFLSSYLEHVTILGLFFALLLAGLGIPIPEDLILITAGNGSPMQRSSRSTACTTFRSRGAMRLPSTALRARPRSRYGRGRWKSSSSRT